MNKFLKENWFKIVIVIIIILIIIVFVQQNHKRIYNRNKDECIKRACIFDAGYKLWSFDNRDFQTRDQCLDYCILTKEENK
jgi:low affinity Fe/Cu permease